MKREKPPIMFLSREFEAAQRRTLSHRLLAELKRKTGVLLRYMARERNEAKAN